jgi:hypothetical protein
LVVLVSKVTRVLMHRENMSGTNRRSPRVARAGTIGISTEATDGGDGTTVGATDGVDGTMVGATGGSAKMNREGLSGSGILVIGFRGSAAMGTGCIEKKEAIGSPSMIIDTQRKHNGRVMSQAPTGKYI